MGVVGEVCEVDDFELLRLIKAFVINVAAVAAPRAMKKVWVFDDVMRFN